MNILITQKQYSGLLREGNVVRDDEIVKQEMIKSINKDIDDLKKENATLISNVSIILDVNSIIDNVKNYLIKSVPTLLTQLKNGTGADIFMSGFSTYLNNLVKSELDKLGFIKRNAIKLKAPNKQTYLNKAKSFDASSFIGAFRSMLDMAVKVGWMDQIESYKPNLWKWESQFENWITNNSKTIKNNIINTISNFLYT